MQQGDPLGPLLFALALQPLLTELASTQGPSRPELVYSYLDDLCLAGDATTVAEAVRTLKDRCPNIGLQLSTGIPNCKDKCEVVLAAGGASTVNASLFPPDFKIVRDGNFELLGGPIGNTAFCNDHTQARVKKACALLDALGELPDPKLLCSSCATAAASVKWCTPSGLCLLASTLRP